MATHYMKPIVLFWIIIAWWASSTHSIAEASSQYDVELVSPSLLHPDIVRFIQLREQSVRLRHQMNVPQAAARLGPTLPDEVRTEYVTLQTQLAHLIETRRTALITEQQGPASGARMLSLSLLAMAETELLANVHLLVAVRNVWPDSVVGWSPSRHPDGQEFARTSASDTAGGRAHGRVLRTALSSLRDLHLELESTWTKGEQNLRVLYPDGVAQGLQRAEQQLALHLAGMRDEDLARDRRILETLSHRSARARERWIDLGKTFTARVVSKEGIVRGDMHDRLHAEEETYLLLRQDLYQLAFKHLPKLNHQDIPYEPAFRLRAVGLSLLSAITLYDNADCLRRHFVDIPGIRPLLNQGDPARQIPSAFWDQVERESARSEYRAYVNAALTAIQQELSRARKAGVAGDQFLIEVLHQAEKSSAKGERKRVEATTRVVSRFDHYRNRIHQFQASLLPSITFNLSKVFGNTIGLVEFRKGKLFGNREWTQFVGGRLQPGDLLLERTPFRLTDVFIPGHFGHVALYVGTEDELRAMDLLDHPLVVSHIQEIRAGRTIVEALRDGTQINTVEHFLNVDDLVILRPKSDAIDREDVKRAITLALSHIGKKYDFGFDTNTWDRITCSELAFDTYVNVRWPFDKVGNTYTIAPDDVASMAGSDPLQPFELVTFIHDGKVVHDQPSGVLSEESYAQVLDRPKQPTEEVTLVGD